MIICEFLKFPWGPHESTLHRNIVKRSLACQGGCPGHGAQLNVPSDGHKNYIKYIEKYISLDDQYSYTICKRVKYGKNCKIYVNDFLYFMEKI